MSARHGRLESAAWLGTGVLLLVLTLDDASSAPGHELAIDGAPDVLDARWLDCGGHHWLLTVGSTDTLRQPRSAKLVIRQAGEEWPVSGHGLEAALVPLDRLVQDRLSGLAPDARARVVQFLAGAQTDHGVIGDAETSRQLVNLHQALRSPLPLATITPGNTLGLRSDHVWRIDDRAFWFGGWARDEGGVSRRLTAISPEGARAELWTSVWWYPRPDVDKAYGTVVAPGDSSPNRGFLAYGELETPSRSEEGWVVQLTDDVGGGLEAPVRRFVTARSDLRSALMRPLQQAALDHATLEHVVHPAIDRYLRSTSQAVEGEELIEFGEVPRNPDVSIVIALDQRLDLVQHQMAQFANDADLRDAEMTYVAAHEAGPGLRALGENLHSLYRLPFRALVLSPGSSVTDAIDRGAEFAAGRLLVLLGRSVFPRRPGWLPPLVERHDSLQNAGAIGAKLLHEDGSIQHAGLAMKARTEQGRTTWELVSEFSGLSGQLPRVNEPRQAMAVSMGCLAVAADRYWEHGGLSGRYLDGAYEEADLCLRLAASGLQNWYVPESELYHLERWGRPTPPPAAARYNAWLFDHLWGERLRSTLGPGVGIQSVARPLRPGARYPRVGVSQPGPPVEIVATQVAESDGDNRLESSLERPRPGDELKPYAETYSFAIEGWARAADGSPLEVELSAPGQSLRRVPANLVRKDLDGAAVGFRAVVGALPLPREFEVSVDAVSQDGERRAIGSIRGRRRALSSGFEARLQPVLITTLGRTGSSWVALLLASHPEILAYQPFVFEPRTTSYWMTALQALAEPASYMQLIRPELYPGHWWLGDQLPIPLPAGLRDVRMAQWLGRDGVETLAGFCQSRVDDFYWEVARSEGKQRPRYFAEKCWPDRAVPRLVSELYSEGREVILMRDLRDIVCSIFGFNAKRGIASFGRESADSDEEFVRSLREGGVRMLESWRERSGTAHLLRYEDLILQPEASLTDLFDYLGVAADPRTVKRVIHDATSTLPDAQSGHQTSGSVAQSVGRWRHDLSPELQAICEESFGDVLTAFGYHEQDVVESGVVPSAASEREEDHSGDAVG